MCRAPIGWQYLALELGMGGLFVASLYRACGTVADTGLQATCAPDGVRLSVFMFFLALVFVYDARHGEIPDAVSIPGVAAGFLINLVRDPSSWPYLLLATAVGAGFFGAQYLAGRGKWVGSGDIILGAMIGAMAGWPGAVFAIFIAYFLGLVAVLVLMIAHRKTLKDTIPLGPFLAAGTAVVLLTDLGGKLMALYGIR
jgi:prepilin signal peptidase PulO-like enzyme (type II secretory pathway)